MKLLLFERFQAPLSLRANVKIRLHDMVILILACNEMKRKVGVTKCNHHRVKKIG